MNRLNEAAEHAVPSLPPAPSLSASYDDWLGYLRKLERVEPYDHPALQSARRSARAIVRQKLGFSPKLVSNSFKAFNFDRCKRERCGGGRT